LYLMMIRERDLLPLHERQAARVAIEKLVEQLGSQAAVGEVLGCSQQAINKVTAYTKIGPTIMRNLLEYLRLDLRELLAQYGDPETMPADVTEPQSIKEMAIDAGVKYGGGASERDVRAIADDAHEAALGPEGGEAPRALEAADHPQAARKHGREACCGRCEHTEKGAGLIGHRHNIRPSREQERDGGG
jgi:hypothetical protein